MKFTLKRPCPHCPFRTDIVQPPLTPAHASKVRAMVRAIVEDGLTFACHKTNVFDAQGEAADTDEVEFCAGAMILLLKLGRPNPMMREARTGQLDLSSPVYDSLEAMLADMDRADYGATPARTCTSSPVPGHGEGRTREKDKSVYLGNNA